MRSLQRIFWAPVNGILKPQLASTCLHEVPPCGAKAGPFLSNLGKMALSDSLFREEERLAIFITPEMIN
jgi:hypothetical protein